MTRVLILAALLAMPSALLAQSTVPAWCRGLPRPAFRSLQRVPSADPWFEVYRVAPATFAIYEPHQSEETISYLIVGRTRALLFDTGMGMGDLREVVTALTSLPVTVLNSHTHNDHVGDNWQFTSILGMPTAFTRTSAKGSRDDAQAEIAPGEICGSLPPGFDPKQYRTRPWTITREIRDGEAIDLGDRTLKVLATPGHTPDAVSLFDRANGLLFTGDTYYPGPIWLYRPETNLSDYAQSIRRLAALQPQLRVVLGAHNEPVASPEVLGRLVTAFDAVQAGRVPPQPIAAGQVLYQVDGFTFRMRPLH